MYVLSVCAPDDVYWILNHGQDLRTGIGNGIGNGLDAAYRCRTNFCPETYVMQSMMKERRDT